MRVLEEGALTASSLCEALRAELPELFECSPAPQGAVRIRTPFLYPDGDVIDVFVEERGAAFFLSDFGDTLGWLRAQSFRDRLTPNQQRMIREICLPLSVELDRGQLMLHEISPTTLAEAVHRLSQAAARVSDICFTFRTWTPNSIGEEVDEWLRERNFEFQKQTQHTGQSGRVWTVDYEITAESRRSLVFLLSTSTRSWAQRLSERVVAECIDLNALSQYQSSTSFVSLFDDADDVWQAEDFELVGNVSHVATWSLRDQFAEFLRA